MITVRAFAAGRNHDKNGVGCQDALDFRIINDGFVFAVADGAGSATLAGEGSELAVRTFCGSLSESPPLYPNDADLIAAYDKVRNALEEEAVKRGCHIEELHTTLFGGVYLHRSLKCAGIGDSLGFVVGEDNEILAPVSPTKGEFVNETIFITSQSWKDFLQVSPLIENPKSLMACSDGLLNIIYSLVNENGLWKVIPHKDVMGDMINYIVQNHRTADVDKEVSDMLRSDKANNLNTDDKALMVFIFQGTGRE